MKTEMKADKLKELLKNTPGVWVVEKNTLVEDVLGDKAPKKLLHRPVKIVFREGLYHLHTIVDQVPSLRSYPEDQILIQDNKNELEIILKGSPYMEDSFVAEIGYSIDEFRKSFFSSWFMTEEEYENYGIQHNIEDLPPVSVQHRKTKPQREPIKDSNPAKDHLLVKKARSPKGVWILGKNLVADAIFRDDQYRDLSTKPMKILEDGRYLHIHYVNNGIPYLRSYPINQTAFDVTEGVLTLTLKGSPEIQDEYSESEWGNSVEIFLASYYHSWPLTKEEVDLYSDAKNTKELPLIRIIPKV